jgi:hypothetical protein
MVPTRAGLMVASCVVAMIPLGAQSVPRPLQTVAGLTVMADPSGSPAVTLRHVKFDTVFEARSSGVIAVSIDEGRVKLELGRGSFTAKGPSGETSNRFERLHLTFSSEGSIIAFKIDPEP